MTEFVFELNPGEMSVMFRPRQLLGGLHQCPLWQSPIMVMSMTPGGGVLAGKQEAGVEVALETLHLCLH